MNDILYEYISIVKIDLFESKGVRVVSIKIGTESLLHP